MSIIPEDDDSFGIYMFKFLIWILVFMGMTSGISYLVIKTLPEQPNYSQMHYEQAFEEGYNAGRLGQPTQANPYPISAKYPPMYTPIKYKGWAEGWLKGNAEILNKK